MKLGLAVAIGVLATTGCHGEPVSSPSDTGSAGDGAADAGTNLLTNGDFESGCAGWNDERTTMTVVSTAHGSKTACMLCSDGADRYWGWQYVDGATLVDGKKYVAEAWLRRMPADGGATGDGSLDILQWDEASGSLVGGGSGSVPLTDEWQHLTAFVIKDSRAKFVEIRFGSTTPRTCFVVDDVSFHAVP